MAYVPNYAVALRIVHAQQRERKLYHAEARPKVTRIGRNATHDELSQLLCQRRKLAIRHAPHIRRALDLRKQRVKFFRWPFHRLCSLSAPRPPLGWGVAKVAKKWERLPRTSNTTPTVSATFPLYPNGKPPHDSARSAEAAHISHLTRIHLASNPIISDNNWV